MIDCTRTPTCIPRHARKDRKSKDDLTVFFFKKKRPNCLFLFALNYAKRYLIKVFIRHLSQENYENACTMHWANGINIVTHARMSYMICINMFVINYHNLYFIRN